MAQKGQCQLLSETKPEVELTEGLLLALGVELSGKALVIHQWLLYSEPPFWTVGTDFPFSTPAC